MKYFYLLSFDGGQQLVAELEKLFSWDQDKAFMLWTIELFIAQSLPTFHIHSAVLRIFANGYKRDDVRGFGSIDASQVTTHVLILPLIHPSKAVRLHGYLRLGQESG